MMDSSLQNSSLPHGYSPHPVLPALRLHNVTPAYSPVQRFHALPADIPRCTHSGSTVLRILHFHLQFLLLLDPSLQSSSHSHGFLPHPVLPALYLHNEGLTWSLLQMFHGLPADTSHCTHHGSTVLRILHFHLQFLLLLDPSLQSSSPTHADLSHLALPGFYLHSADLLLLLFQMFRVFLGDRSLYRLPVPTALHR